MGVFTPVLPIYLHDIGLNTQAVGTIMAAGPIAAIVGPPLWGYTADRIHNKRQVLLLCLCGAMFTGLFVNKFASVALLFALYFVYNFFQSSTSPLADSVVLCSLESRHYGSIRLWGSLGFAAGALLCGQALGFLGSGRLFGVYFLLAACALGFGVFMPKDPNQVGRTPIQLKSMLNLLRNRRFCLFLLIVILVMIPYGAYSGFLGIYLKELGASPLQIGLAWTIAALAEVPLFAWGSSWLSPKRAWTLLAIGASVFGVRWLLYGVWFNVSAILCLQLLQSVSFGLFFLVSVQLVNWLSPKELKAVGQTLFSSATFGLSFAVGNFAGGYIGMSYGLNSVFIFSGLFALAGGVLAFTAGHKLTS